MNLNSALLVETRNVLLQQLQNKRKAAPESFENSATHDTSQAGIKVSERQEENIQSREKGVTDIVNATGRLEIDNDENVDQWLKETEIDTCKTLDRQKKLEHEEDVSFSDLEDDDNDLSSRLSSSRQAQGIIRAPSSTDWVQLNESSEVGSDPQKARQSISRERDSDVESNDWLKVDDFD
uniref:BSD domain-containing protein n=1 Tax=Manihot esculenta TaxID=3983 RepID=A0A2C9UKI1_MANES